MHSLNQKKLVLSAAKCSKIHIGNKKSREECPELKVHEESMKSSEKEKYLGDYVTNKANSKETIKARTIRGNAIISEMRAMLRDIPLGNRRTQIGLVLRQAWFINGCFVNSEVWTGYAESNLDDLIVIDHSILRLITGSQAKVPVEMLYLETGQIPVKSIISIRRILYLHNILSRHEDQLVRRIYSAMKESPVKGDWIIMVKDDMSSLNMTLSDDDISAMGKIDFKVLVKRNMREKVFKDLEELKESHSKVRGIFHENLRAPQSYLTSGMFSNKLSSLLFNLRSHCVNEFRSNFQSSTQHILCPV